MTRGELLGEVQRLESRRSLNVKKITDLYIINAYARSKATSKERLKRFHALDTQFCPTDFTTVIVQLDFSPKVEELDYTACDSIVSTCHPSTCALRGN